MTKVFDNAISILEGENYHLPASRVRDQLRIIHEYISGLGYEERADELIGKSYGYKEKSDGRL